MADIPVGTKMKVDQNGVAHQGSMKIDVTCVNAEVRYPTDIDLLNDAREVSDRIIDRLYKELKVQRPGTYRQVAGSNYLNIIKRRKKSSKQVRMGVRGQLGFFKRNLGYIDQLINSQNDTISRLPQKYRQFLDTIRLIYAQQMNMYKVHIPAFKGIPNSGG